MRVVSLRFPGNFEDAFLYMGRLIAITENHSVRIYDMKNVVSKLQEDEILLDVPTLLFFRNDLIDQEEFRDQLHDESGKAAFLKAIDKIESKSIQIDADFIETVEWDLKIKADILLDLNIYNRRLYIGTNTGLYHFDIDWESENTIPINEAQKRLEAKCIHTTAKFGTVNASCGSEGLFSFLDDFNLGRNNNRKEKHIPEYSLRNAWLNFDVVNYPTTTSPTLFSSIQTKPRQELIESQKNFEKESLIVTDLEQSEFDFNNLVVNSNLNNKIDLKNIQFVYNSSKSLFISTYDGSFFTLGLQDNSSSSIPRISYYNKYMGLGSLVASIHTLGVKKAGIILEMDEQVLLFAHGKFIPIFNSEVISIRTFAGSKHYKNIVSLTTPNEILLIAIFDEEA
ncbi:hypothetical protein [Nostoc sp. NZL]|uniref:hypothetical protein n=1 Tax=Nostoc sp. NZL TaxID=2650612 RepID=UPI0018C834D1|nr:hypothetical protein [Nostoc sp. NZL]MBG1243369.1 hypothetical protein [Nostoc sp. NZL]